MDGRYELRICGGDDCRNVVHRSFRDGIIPNVGDELEIGYDDTVASFLYGKYDVVTRIVQHIGGWWRYGGSATVWACPSGE